MKRKHLITVAATQEERAFFQEAAKQNGLSLSALIRHLIIRLASQQRIQSERSGSGD